MNLIQSGICILLLCVAANAEIPDYIKVCKRDNEDISACIIKSVEILAEKLLDGIPELGVPPIEPLTLDDLQISKGLKLNVTDIVINGAGKFKIKELKAEVNKNRFAVLLHIPVLDLVGKHSIDMELLTIPLKGSGPFTAKFTEFTIGVKMKGRVVDDNGVNRLKFDPFDVQVAIAGIKQLNLEGLFEDNPTLKMAGKAVIDDNMDVLLDELRPEIEHSMSTTLTRLANQITSHFTYEELFPQ